ncbi:MAG: helix-turn-helix domain-containing protein [Gaiellales bacterium]
MEGLIEQLRRVGMTLYEARLFVTLLQHGAQNGNELSRRSGVPSSKVYSTLEKMMVEGWVQAIKGRSGTSFVALDPGELVDRLRRRYNEPLDYLAEQLPALAAPIPEDAFLNITGASGVLAAARQLVALSSATLNLSVWEPELEELWQPIEDAAARGVRIFGMLYSAGVETPPGTWHRHSYEEIVGDRLKGRMLSLVADGSETLVALMPHRGQAHGVRTRNAVLTLIVAEYLHHDLVLQRAQVNIGFDEWDKWWLADPELRGTILGEALDQGAAADGERTSR